MNITFSLTAFASIRLEHTFVMLSVHENFAHHHRMILARPAANLILPQQPFYPHLVYHFADQPHQMVRRDEFRRTGGYEAYLPLVVGLVGYLVAFAFTHTKNFIMTQAACVYKKQRTVCTY
jgi:hypothetical protein